MHIIVDCPEESQPRALTWVSSCGRQESDSLEVPPGTCRADLEDIAAGAMLGLVYQCETAEERDSVMTGSIVVHAA